MRGLNRGPLNSVEVHNNAEYDHVYAEEDGLQVLINGLNENARNELRVRGVNDLNELHAIIGFCTNDSMMDLGNEVVRENEVRLRENASSMPENLHVYVRKANNSDMQGNNNTNERDMHGGHNEYK